MTDYWPDEEGFIDSHGHTIGFAYADAAVAEGAACKFGTSASGRIAVTTAAGIGDGWAVALKAIGASEIGPIATYGLMKMTAAQTAAINIGEFVMNSSEGGVIHQTVDGSNVTGLKLFGGASYVLGLALQASAAKEDEIVILLGRSL